MKELLKATLSFVADKKDPRYYLRGVCFTRDGGKVRLEVSDGHSALIATIFNPDAVACFVEGRHVYTFESIANGLKVGGTSIEQREGDLFLGAIKLEKVDCNYPDALRATGYFSSKGIPDVEKGVDFKKLAKVCKGVQDLLAKQKYKTGKAIQSEASAAFKWKGVLPDGTEWEAVLMPCRV